MEFMQIGFGSVHPVDYGPLYRIMLTGAIWSLHPRIKNGLGEEFLERYIHGIASVQECMDVRATHFPFSTRDNSKYIDIAIHKEIFEGHGTEHGGVFLDLSGVPNDKIRDFEEKWRVHFPSSMLSEPIEIASFAHAFNGGVRINEFAETTLQGLFAAGEVAAGPHGADRLGGGMHTACLVFGARAGRYAAERASSMTTPELDHAQVKRLCENVLEMVESRGDQEISDTKLKLQNAMWRSALTIRNERGLQGCIDLLRRIQDKEMQELHIDDHDIFNALSLRNLCEVGLMIATAALQRRESRGSHYREDYPEMSQKLGGIIVLEKEKPPSFTYL
jgi:succinate dehydrogenase/fumarate reductase flavoprotein subunit